MQITTSCLAIVEIRLLCPGLHQLIISVVRLLPWRQLFRFEKIRITAWLLAFFFTAPAGRVRAADPAAEKNEIAVEVTDPYISPTNGLGSWIWASNTFNGQTCQLWRTVEIPATAMITKARLVMTADNEFTLYLDGRELGRGADWRELFVFDLSRILTPGRHVLAVRAMNSFSIAGMLLGLRVDLADKRIIEVQSDQS